MIIADMILSNIRSSSPKMQQSGPPAKPSFEYVPHHITQTLESEFQALASANLDRKSRRDKLKPEDSLKVTLKRPAPESSIKVKRIKLLVKQETPVVEAPQMEYDDHELHFDRLFVFERDDVKQKECMDLWHDYQAKLRELYSMEVRQSLLDYKPEDFETLDTFKLLSVSFLIEFIMPIYLLCRSSKRVAFLPFGTN